MSYLREISTQRFGYLPRDARCTPAFAPALSAFQPDTLDDPEHTVFGLTSDYRIAFVGEGWLKFARVNGGEPEISERWGLGADYWGAIPPAARPQLAELFARSQAEAASGNLHPLITTYDCPTPTLRRRYSMQVYPLGEHGFLVVNSWLSSEPARAEGAPWEIPAGGFVRQCANCRRVMEPESNRWVFVPEWVAKPPARCSHGVCEPCSDYFYRA